MKIMYDLLILIFSFIPREEYYNLRLVNREFNEVYQHFLKIQQHLDPAKHVFVKEDSLQVFNFQEMVVEDERKFVRFRKGQRIIIRSLKFMRDGTPYCKDPERRFNIFKTECMHCDRCNGFAYCKDVMIIDYYCVIRNCKKKNITVINQQSFHKHVYCIRCKKLFDHILKIYDDYVNIEKLMKKSGYLFT
jgi:hypothetical protein